MKNMPAAARISFWSAVIMRESTSGLSTNAWKLSIGDYVLTGGELPALIVMDAVARFIPGVLGKMASAVEDSFSTGLLEYPQYTRPVEFEGLEVPEVLRNGNHALINRWRRKEALKATYLHRPDLLAELGKEDVLLLNEIKQELAGDNNG